MISARARLRNIGEPRPGHAIPALTGALHSAPRSLRRLLQAMLPPRSEEWRRVRTLHFTNEPWTHECQGLTSDGDAWYVSSNNPSFRAIHKFSLDFREKLAAVELPAGGGDHIGDVAYHNGSIYVPISSPQRRVWEIDPTLATVRIVTLADDPDPGLGWCAINPWNGYLYTCPGHSAHAVHAFDPASSFAYRGSLELHDETVNGIQGGCFSANGHLYLTSDRFTNARATKDIRAYSALNGAFLGSCPVPYDASKIPGEEMEGLAVLSVAHPDGTSTHVHVVVLDNDVFTKDDVIIHQFAVPDWSVL